MNIVCMLLAIAVLALIALVIDYQDKNARLIEAVDFLRRENFRLFQGKR